MVMYFQDDFWQAVSKLESIEDQNAAIVALVRYHFDKSEPTNPIANAILTVCKDRIELSKKRSKAGATRKQNKSKTEAKSNQSCSIASHSLSNSTSSNNLQVDNQPGTDFLLEELETPFSVQCLKVINDVLEQQNYNVPRGYEDYLDSMGQHYTVEQVEAMVRHFKRSWENDKAMKDNLRANVLLNPKNFESYMQTAISAKDKPESFEEKQLRKNEEYIRELEQIQPAFIITNE